MFVVAGESLIDLVAEPTPGDAPLRLVAHPGGSPYNCAIALARLGNATGFLCPISRDALGDRLLAPLRADGVAVLLKTRVAEPTSLAVVSLDERGRASYQFYRHADRAFTGQGLREALPPDMSLFQIGGFCAVEPEDAEIWLALAAHAAQSGAVISMDPNLRPALVDDLDAYRARLDRFFSLVHLVKLSDEDLAILDPTLSIEQHAAALLARPHCELVVVTMGEVGSRAFSRSGEGRAGVFTPDRFGDTVGAGDSLMAGILTALRERGDLAPGRLGRMDGAALGEMLRFGAVTAGLNCARKGCHPPSRAEVDAVLAGA